MYVSSFTFALVCIQIIVTIIDFRVMDYLIVDVYLEYEYKGWFNCGSGLNEIWCIQYKYRIKDIADYTDIVVKVRKFNVIFDEKVILIILIVRFVCSNIFHDLFLNIQFNISVELFRDVYSID